MGKSLHFLMVVAFFLTALSCYSQTSLVISEPRLELIDNRIHMSYDILHGEPSEKYEIRVDIKDENGNQIDASALYGDIGVVEEGGNNKKIVWNLEADSLFLKAYVFVKIVANVIPPPEPVVIEPEEDQEPQEDMTQPNDLALEKDPSLTGDSEQTEETEQQVMEDDAPKVKEDAEGLGSRVYNRKALLLQSLAIPGLGLTRSTQKPHWIRAVAGYGCIGGSVIFNRQGIKTYSTVENIVDHVEAEEAINKSIRQDRISEGLAYAAIGIWIADLVWTWVGTSGLNSGTFSGEMSRVSVGTNIDLQSNVPLVCFRYSF